MKQSYLLLLFLVLIFISKESTAQTTDETPQVETTLKTKSFTSYAGIGVGQRRLSLVPNNVYVRTSSTDYKSIDLGNGKPVEISLFIVGASAKSNFAFTANLEGFLGTNSGIGVLFGGGFNLGGGIFTATPNLQIGIHRMFTTLDVIKLDSFLLPAFFIAKDSKVWFVGPTAKNGDRGAGSNIAVQAESAFFTLKPALNMSVKVGAKYCIFADIAYNVVFATTKNEIWYNGRGYNDTDELTNKDLAPHIVKVQSTGTEALVDNNKKPIPKTPYNMSGVMIQIGFGKTL